MIFGDKETTKKLFEVSPFIEKKGLKKIPMGSF